MSDGANDVDPVLSFAENSRFTDSDPVYQQIAASLRSAAAAGILVPGTRLPPERRLAEAFGVSRMTLRQALDAVQLSGELTRAVGGRGGVAVAARSTAVNIADLVGLRSQLLRTTRTAGSRIISAETVPADSLVAAALEIDHDALVHRIVRVRFADDVAVVLERSSFPAQVLPDFLKQDLAGSLYAILKRYGQAPAYATHDLAPLLVDDNDAELLGMASGVPVLQVVRTTSTSRGRPIEHSADLFRSDQLRVTVAGRIATEPAAGPESLGKEGTG